MGVVRPIIVLALQVWGLWGSGPLRVMRSDNLFGVFNKLNSPSYIGEFQPPDQQSTSLFNRERHMNNISGVRVKKRCWQWSVILSFSVETGDAAFAQKS